MTEQAKTDAANQTTAPAGAGTVGPKGPAGQPGASADLTVQDLGIIKSIIDAACQRGAFKANEMQAVGATFNKLESFLQVVQAQQKDLEKKGSDTAPAKPAVATGGKK